MRSMIRCYSYLLGGGRAANQWTRDVESRVSARPEAAIREWLGYPPTLPDGELQPRPSLS